MKILHEQININGPDSIKVKWDDFPHFVFPLHYHSEYEIVYVLKSFGKRYVGDSAEDFTDGDLVLLGSNLPHFWKNDSVFYHNRPNLHVNAVVVQFPNDLPGIGTNDLPEFKNIQKLLKRSERGIQFLEPDVAKVGSRLLKLLKINGFERYVEFLKILEEMASSSNCRLLSGPVMNKELYVETDSRLDKVLRYINHNYTGKLTLSGIAKMACMNPNSFCRFFRDGTGKTIIEYIHEMRVGNACKLIIKGEKNISEIAYECGFNNITNFNRIFKKKTGLRPSEYKKKYTLNQFALERMGVGIT